jgi:mono/diheme cytochrome c family protein
MKLRIAAISLVALCSSVGSAWAQQAGVADEVRKGHDLAVAICSNCHVVADDQPFAPILRQPAPSFESIAQRAHITTDYVRGFLTSTHRSLTQPEAMPNPELIESHIDQVTAYLLSLRKQQ